MVEKKSLLISEIFDLIDKEPNRAKKIKILRDNYTPQLEYVLRGGLDPNIEWLLPEGVPPFRKDDSPTGLSPSNLYKESRLFYLFCKVNNQTKRPDLKKADRERLFIEMLERIDKNDADILLQMKDKNFTTKGLTLKLCHEAFPDKAWTKSINEG